MHVRTVLLLAACGALSADAAPDGGVASAPAPSNDGDRWYCDTPDRVILVTWSPGTLSKVVVIPRAHVDRPVTGSVTKVSCNDPCDGPEGGWAGCSSQQRCTLHTDVAGARVLATARLRSDLPLGVINSAGDRASRMTTCGPQPQYVDSEPIAICSTRHHTAILDYVDGDPAPSLQRLTIEVFAPGGRPIGSDYTSKPTIRRDGVLDPATSDDTHRIYRFPEPGADDVTLALTTDGSPGAALTIGHDVEPCFAFAFP